MIEGMPHASPFPPLPLRARSVTEILDTAVKVYQRYFWILLGWAAIQFFGQTMLSFTGGGGMLGLVFSPLEYAAVTCCLAAALRGQSVTFSQTSQFLWPRFGRILGWYLLAAVVTFLAMLLLAIPVVALFGLLFWIVAMTSPVLLILVGAVLALCLLSAFAVGLVYPPMVAVVVAMEDQVQGPLRRTWNLLQHEWRRVMSLMVVLGLGCLALAEVVETTAVLIYGVSNITHLFRNPQSLITPNGDLDPAFYSFMRLFTVANGLIWMLFNPLSNTVVGLFYLDIRVRKEALDLEWSAYQSNAASPQPVTATILPGTETAFQPPVHPGPLN